MTDFTIRNKFSRTTRVQKREFSGLRLYRQSPFNANLQVWTGTDRQSLIANMPLNAEDCRKLAFELCTIADQLKKLEPAPVEDN